MSRGNKKAIVLIIIGIAIVAVPFLLRLREQGWDGDISDFVKQEEQDDEEKHAKKENALLSKEGVIGVVEIPSLNIRYPIYEGVGAEQLNAGIGHMDTTTEPCGQGNCVLAGHNGSRKGVFFTYLCNVELGAKVTITTKDHVSHTYSVKETKIVNPYDSWVTEESETELLTLFTCANHGTNRFVVKCEPDEDYYSKGGDAEIGTSDRLKVTDPQ